MKSISRLEWWFPFCRNGDFLTPDRCGKLRRNTHPRYTGTGWLSPDLSRLTHWFFEIAWIIFPSIHAYLPSPTKTRESIRGLFTRIFFFPEKSMKLPYQLSRRSIESSVSAWTIVPTFHAKLQNQAYLRELSCPPFTRNYKIKRFRVNPVPVR